MISSMTSALQGSPWAMWSEDLGAALRESKRELLGMAGVAFRANWTDVAVIIMLGFACFLRTGEVLGLKVGDLEFFTDKLILNLGPTKTSKDSEETTVTEDRSVIAAARRFCRGMARGGDGGSR